MEKVTLNRELWCIFKQTIVYAEGYCMVLVLKAINSQCMHSGRK